MQRSRMHPLDYGLYSEVIVKRFFFTLALLITFFSAGIFADALKPMKSMRLLMDSQPVELETPILKSGATYLVPLQDLLKPLKADLRYNRKEDYYEFSSDTYRFSVTIIPFTKEIWIQDTQSFLSTPSVSYENRLYIPVIEFFAKLGLPVLEDGSHLRIQTVSLDTAPKVNRDTGSESLGVLPGKPLTMDPDMLFSAYPPGFPLLLTMGDQSIDIASAIVFVDKRLYVAASALDTLQIKTQLTDSSVEIQYQKERLALTLNEKSGTKWINSQKQAVSLVHPPLMQNGALYLPLESLLFALDLAPKWIPQDRTIAILAPITGIEFKKLNGLFQLVINASYPMATSIPQFVDWPKRIYLDIPNAELLLEKQEAALDHSVFKKISAGMNTNKSARVVLEVTEDLYGVASPSPSGSILRLYPLITNVLETEKEGAVHVAIKGTLPLYPYTYVQNNQVFIQIDNSITKLPEVTPGQSEIISKIRSSQVQLDPPRSLITIDLKSPRPFSSVSNPDSMVELSFPLPRLSAAERRFSRGLKRKLVVIDPGHGGNDPGAIAITGVYEKEFTLDVSQRLEKLLKSNGIKVLMARTGDENPSLQDRTNLANENHADLLVSVHFNSFKPHATGTETYYYKFQDKILAGYIHEEMTKALKIKDNGIKLAKFYVLNHSNMPAVLLEPLYLTHANDIKLLDGDTYRQAIAEAAYKGILTYFKNAP